MFFSTTRAVTLLLTCTPISLSVCVATLASTQLFCAVLSFRWFVRTCACVRVSQGTFAENRVALDALKGIEGLKKVMKKVMPFVQFVREQAVEKGREALSQVIFFLISFPYRNDRRHHRHHRRHHYRLTLPQAYAHCHCHHQRHVSTAIATAGSIPSIAATSTSPATAAAPPVYHTPACTSKSGANMASPLPSLLLPPPMLLSITNSLLRSPDHRTRHRTHQVMPFDELAVLQGNAEYLRQTLELAEIKILPVSDTDNDTIINDCTPGDPYTVFN
jgi:hypothetical protein